MRGRPAHLHHFENPPGQGLQASTKKISISFSSNSGITLYSLLAGALLAYGVRAAGVSSAGKPGVSNPDGGVPFKGCTKAFSCSYRGVGAHGPSTVVRISARSASEFFRILFFRAACKDLQGFGPRFFAALFARRNSFISLTFPQVSELS